MSQYLINPYRFAAACDPPFWEELGRTTLSSEADDITVSGLANKRYLMVLVHIILVGILILFIHFYIIDKYIKYFKINKYEKYLKIFIDLIITFSLIGLQRNLLYKIRYISLHHPIRSELIE